MTSCQDETRTPVKFRVIREEDFDQVVEMVKVERFCLPRLKLEIIIREGHYDFYVLEDSNDGTIVGVTSVSKTRPGEAALGNVVVRKDCRSQGLGHYMVRRVLSLHDDVTVSCFSTADIFYKSLGCKFSCQQSAYSMMLDVKKDKVNQYCQENVPNYSVAIIPFTEDRQEDLMRYDTGCRGYENRRFVSLLTGFAESIILAVTGHERRIVGYTAGCGEDDVSAIRFSGLYADDDKVAALLFRHMLMDSFPKYTKAKVFTINSRRFLAQFGDTLVIKKFERASTGQKVPEPISENKLYDLSDADVSY